jgi:hypothetical protein
MQQRISTQETFTSSQPFLNGIDIYLLLYWLKIVLKEVFMKHKILAFFLVIAVALALLAGLAIERQSAQAGCVAKMG